MSFRKDVRGLDPSSPEYRKIAEQYRQIEAARNEKHALKHNMAMEILRLSSVVKSLNLSKLMQRNNEQLIQIGRIAREYNKVLKAAKLGDESYAVRDSRDF